MPARYVHNGTSFVELGGGASSTDPSDFYPMTSTDTVNTGSSSRSTITATASATPHTAGSWVEVDASLSTAMDGLHLAFGSISTATVDSSTLLDIGTGAAASETVWATIAVGYMNGPRSYFVPGRLAAGARVSVRARSAIASQSVAFFPSFLVPRSVALGAPVTYGGANMATTSKGVAITNPGSTNTKGDWTQIVASTSAAHNMLLVCPQANSATTMAASGVLVDIGIGAAASETVIIPDIYMLGSTSEQYLVRSPLTYGVDIPSGSRLSARFARAAAGNDLDLVLVAA